MTFDALEAVCAPLTPIDGEDGASAIQGYAWRPSDWRELQTRLSRHPEKGPA